MQSSQIEAALRDAASRLCNWSFEQLASLADKPWVEEVGSHDSTPGDHCQIEAELLDQMTEDDLQILNITITADDFVVTMGTVIVAFSDGRVEWDQRVFRYVGGVPQPSE